MEELEKLRKQIRALSSSEFSDISRSEKLVIRSLVDCINRFDERISELEDRLDESDSETSRMNAARIRNEHPPHKIEPRGRITKDGVLEFDAVSVVPNRKDVSIDDE